jgi:predicted HicB family RNase H-like nuclease
MMGTLIYKSFAAHVEFDWMDLLYVGHVVTADYAIGFCGATLEEAERDYHEAVDSYLAMRVEPA